MRRRQIRVLAAATMAASAVLAGCGGGSHHSSSESSHRKVDVVHPGSYPASGTTAVGGGVTVRFLSPQPAKARLKVSTAGAPAAPSGRAPIASPAHFELVGGTFGKGAVITFPLPAALASPDPAGVIEVGTREDGATGWSTAAAVVNPEARTVTVRAAHFSWYEPWTWDWSNLAADANQDIGQLVGKRTGPASCSSSSPTWVRSTPGVENGPALVVRGCTESQNGNLVVQLVNNRAYGLVLHYGGPVTFGWHEAGGNPLDKQENKLADVLVGDNALYLPPGGRASVGISQPSSFNEEDFRVDVTKASLGLDVLRTIGTDLLPDVGDKAIAEVAKACGGTLTEAEKPDSITNLGAVRDDGLAAIDCITTGFTEAVRDGLLDGKKVAELGQVASSLKKASVVGKALNLYGVEWDLGDLFVSEAWVKPNPSFGWGFSVFARTVKTSAPAATQVVHIAPVDGAGEPTAGYTVTRDLADGNCEPGSDTGAIAYRCFSGNGVYDPCWTDRSDSTGLTVRCLMDPWGKTVTLIRLTAVPEDIPAQADPQIPIGLTLSDGEQCFISEGAHSEFNGRPIDYGCKSLSVLRNLDESGPLWRADTVNYSTAAGYSSGPTLTVTAAYTPDPSLNAQNTEPGGAPFTVTADQVSIRARPSLSAPVIGVLNRGDVIRAVCVDLGDAVPDPATGSTDDVWVPLSDRPGYVSDVYVSPHTVIPPGTDTSHC